MGSHKMVFPAVLFISFLYLAKAIPLLKDDPEMGRRDCSHILSFEHRKYYILHERVSIPGMPADIDIEWQRDNIFFTLISNDMKMTLQVLYNEDPRRLKEIATPGLGQSTAVDNVKHNVYLATDSGVYKYVNDSQVELYTANGEDIMYIAVNDIDKGMYIATFPHNLVLKITNNGRKVETFGAIPNGHGLKVDRQGNLYFYTANTAYVLKKNTRIPIKITGFNDDSNKLFFVTKTGQVMAMDLSSRLYIIIPAVPSAVYLGTFNINDVNAFAMDSENNVIIGKSQEIMRFVLYDKNPCDNDVQRVIFNDNSGEDNQRLLI